jgi:mono/diheme cytochrome c family protein
MRPRAPFAILVLATFATLGYGRTGAELFGEYCASCHGTDGKAKTPAGRKLGAKDLSASKLSDQQIAAQITKGTKNERGAEKMPSFKDRLNADDIDALVAYVKTFRR